MNLIGWMLTCVSSLVTQVDLLLHRTPSMGSQTPLSIVSGPPSCYYSLTILSARARSFEVRIELPNW